MCNYILLCGFNKLVEELSYADFGVFLNVGKLHDPVPASAASLNYLARASGGETRYVGWLELRMQS